jgi:hypothetical protein
MRARTRRGSSRCKVWQGFVIATCSLCLMAHLIIQYSYVNRTIERYGNQSPPLHRLAQNTRWPPKGQVHLSTHLSSNNFSLCCVLLCKSCHLHLQYEVPTTIVDKFCSCSSSNASWSLCQVSCVPRFVINILVSVKKKTTSLLPDASVQTAMRRQRRHYPFRTTLTLLPF